MHRKLTQQSHILVLVDCSIYDVSRDQCLNIMDWIDLWTTHQQLDIN